MENFIVSARKYRPSTFNSVVGQISITTTLKNAIKNNQLAHAYLFCGPRGVGKTTCARIFARTINCAHITSENEACNECESCKSFNENRSFSIHELDAASNNSVEDIRTLIEQVRIPPQIGKYSIYIIDEVHMLSASAFNAFLKTLEEPPEHAIFILATTEKHKIIPTILSRCQIFDFNRIKVADSVQYLKHVAEQESVQIEEEGLNVIAQKADGAMRDALSIFDQIVSFSGNEISYQNVIQNLNVLDYDYYFQIVDSFLENEVTKVLLLFNKIIEKGFDGYHFINGLGSHIRDVLVSKDTVTLQLLEVGESIKEKYLIQAQKSPQGFLYDALSIINKCDINYKASQNKRLFIELTLIQLSQIIESKKKGTSLTQEKSKLQKIKVEEYVIATENKPINGILKKNKQKKTKEINSAIIQTDPPKTFSIKSAIQAEIDENRTITKTKIETNTNNSLKIPEQSKNFTEKDLEIKLKEFVEIKKSNELIKCALTTHKPKLKENYNIVIPVDNLIQEENIKKIKFEITNYLKYELQNNNIQLNTEVVKTKATGKIYTDTEKFDYLSQKNHVLGILKQKFSLDFE